MWRHPAGARRWKAKRADAIRTGLDTLLKDGMPVEVHVESIGKDSPRSLPIIRGEIPGGTGGDKPAFIGMPPGGTGKMQTAMVKMTGTRMSVGMTLKMMMKKMMLTPISMMKMMAMTGRKMPVKDKAGDKDDGRDDDGRDDDDKDDTDDRDDDIKSQG